MLRRILIVVAVLYLVWRIAAAWGRRLTNQEPGADRFSRFSGGAGDRQRRDVDEPKAPEELVPCARCGTYVPVDRALASGEGAFYCSRECRQAADAPAEHGAGGR